MNRALTALAGAALLLPLAACGSGSSAKDAGSSGGKQITVFAAASLTDTFTSLGKEFEAEHKGTKVRFSFGGSSDLVSQIQEGAPADVFASADTPNMTKLGSEAVDPQSFASNILEIATPPGNPKHVKTFQDLARPGTKVVVCAPEVPCGSAAAKVEKVAKTTIKPVSQEQAVTDVLAKVTSGDADAGLVYVTDVKAAGSKVTGVTFPEAAKVVNTYPIATLKDSKNTATAKQFVDFVRSAEGQKVLTDAGFGKP